MRTLDGDLQPWPHARPPAWVGDVIAAALVAAAALLPFPWTEFRPSTPLVFVVVLLPAVILPLRRRWPVSILAACLGCYGVAALLGTVAPGVVLAAAIAMFGVATRSNRRTTMVVASASIVAVIILSLLASLGDVFDPRTFQFAVTIAFAAAAGDATRFRREFILAVTERARKAEEDRETEAQRRVTEERLRIARDLHDAVAHQISVISLNAGVASTSLETRPEKTREALANIREASRSVLTEIGDLLEMLRRADDDSTVEGVRAPQPGLDRLDDLLERFRASGLDVVARREGAVEDVPVAVDRVAYRVVQEGLTNAHKHGADRRAHVLLSADAEALRVVVTNPTTPDDPDQVAASEHGGHGLIGLRERVALVRGSVEAGSTPGGYRLAATLPLTRTADAP
ncbi:sensor histidine kinase [Microbacterium sp. SLBN-146]|uniref:sensor histidine kinase n=1 Tax=Microbacterium sp. SLBN-146 TaxID=2768457 RepID=UPI00114F5D5A|nr:histidine kinase [Microbacterium sp. SLBN-146]